MKKNTLPPKSSNAFVPISIAVLLIIGVFVSIVQVQQPQQQKSSAQTAFKNCSVPDSDLLLVADEKAMFDMINAYRNEKGLNSLFYNANLQRAAQWMSNDMIAHKSLSHTDSTGRGVETRLNDCGFKDQSWGENISEGYQSVAAAFEAWKNSPGHNANMLGSFTHMGIAVNSTYWTLDLATVSGGGNVPPPLVPGVTTQPTTSAGGSPTAQPTAPPNTLSDLIVQDMKIAPNTGSSCGPLGVLVTIKNKGTKATSGSITVKVNSGFGTIGGSLASEATATIWLQSFSTGENTALVDPNNQIVELDEANNQLKKFLTTPTKNPQCPTPVPTSAPANLTPAPTNYPGFVVNPNDTQVLVSIKLPGVGIGGNKTPKNLSRKVTVTIYDLENEQIMVGGGFLTYDKNDLFRGIVHLGRMPNGAYYVKIVAEHTLQELVLPQFQQLQNDRLNALSPVLLITGELTDDNKLTLADYNVALNCFQDKKCGAKPITDDNGDGTINVYDFVDLNDDGKVNVVDYNLFLHNFREFSGD